MTQRVALAAGASGIIGSGLAGELDRHPDRTTRLLDATRRLQEK